MIGTAMGASLSVIYAIIFMILLESPIINDVRFSQYIRLYKRFIDDLVLKWAGQADALCDFRRSLTTADEQSAWTGTVVDRNRTL